MPPPSDTKPNAEAPAGSAPGSAVAVASEAPVDPRALVDTVGGRGTPTALRPSGLAVSETTDGMVRSPVDALDALDPAPKQLGKYRVDRVLGEGGMSVVYLATDEALERRVAIKVLHRHLARDPEARARLTREARASARLRHPNIPEIHDFSGAHGSDSGRGYIVSEFVDGWSLAELLHRQPPTLPEVGVALVLGAARALAHAHREGVIHRDVKPENILVARDGAVKLTDFGIAHVVGGDTMTLTGTLLGSPLHMAPEQIRGERDIDARVDVWGFGTVLFMALAGGRHAFEGGNPHVAMQHILHGERADVRRLSTQVDSTLAGLVDRCLAVDTADRERGMESVLATLSSWLEARDVPDPRAIVRSFAEDPVACERELTPRIVAGLMRLAGAATSPHEAVALLGRVLLLSPDHAEAEAALGRHLRTLRSKRASRRSVIAGLGALAAGLLWLVWPSGPPPLTPSAHLATRGSEAAGPTVEPLPALRPLAGTPSREPARPPEPVAAAADAMSGDDGLTPAAAQVIGPEDSLASDSSGPAVAAVEGAADAGPQEPSDLLPRPRPDRPSSRAVEARITVYPPAVRLRVGALEVTPGKPFRTAAGVVDVVLTHPGCPTCAPDARTLEVTPDARGKWTTHLVFRRVGGASFEAARLSLRCPGDGGWAIGPTGERLACNVTHNLPVDTERPTLVTLTAYDAQGTPVATRRFTLRPGAEIVWQL